MSLLGLLSMGRSFGSVRQRPAAYHVAEGWLPDFGRRQEREVGDVGGHDTVLSAASWPERNVGDEAPFFGDAAPIGGHARPLAAETSRRGLDRRGRGSPPEAAGPLVQGELSLASVRVVRNDLSAEDLELVPRPIRPLVEVERNPASTAAPLRRGGGWRGWLAHWRCLFRRRAC